MPDNIKSRMNFIIEERAKSRADMEVLKERQAETQRLIKAEREEVRQLVNVTMSLVRHGEETDRLIRELGARTNAFASSRKRGPALIAAWTR